MTRMTTSETPQGGMLSAGITLVATCRMSQPTIAYRIATRTTLRRFSSSKNEGMAGVSGSGWPANHRMAGTGGEVNETPAPSPIRMVQLRGW